MIVLAPISDTHLDGSARNADRATRVLRYLNNLPAPVDAVLVTGDIADHGLPAEYEQAIRQRGEKRLAALVHRHPQVVAVLCGHAHTPAATTFAGRPLLVAPGVVSTLKLPWEHGDGLDHDLPPAIAFHVLDDTWRLTTHYRVIT